jgi:hypothetical protein
VGYALRQEGRLLADFVAYCQRRGITRVTIEAVFGWATQPSAASPTWWATRLEVVRGFAAQRLFCLGPALAHAEPKTLRYRLLQHRGPIRPQLPSSGSP